jgi:hypothetical protein
MSDDLIRHWCRRLGTSTTALDRIETQAARIAELEAALKDMAKHVWRGDWDKLKPETRSLLDEKK